MAVLIAVYVGMIVFFAMREYIQSLTAGLGEAGEDQSKQSEHSASYPLHRFVAPRLTASKLQQNSDGRDLAL